MAKVKLLQIRVTPEQKALIVKAAGDLPVSVYVLGRLFSVRYVLEDGGVGIVVDKSAKGKEV